MLEDAKESYFIYNNLNKFKIQSYRTYMITTLSTICAGQSPEITQLILSCKNTFKIHKIEGLTKFKNLQILVLNNHAIRKIENIDSLRNLKVLNLECNQLEILENLDSLHKLQELYLSYNSIKIVKQNFEKIHLRILHLAYNQLTAQELINPLTKLTSLIILSLHGNPITQQLTYHTLIGTLLKKLVILDEKEIKKIDIEFQSQEIHFLRKALNQIIQQKNQLINQISKHNKLKKPQKSQIDVPHSSDLEQTKFYVDALKDQNRILEIKITQLEKEIERLGGEYLKQSADRENDEKVMKLAEILQAKYKQSLLLEKNLNILDRNEELTERQQVQREEILNTLKENEKIIKNYHKKLTKLKEESNKGYLQSIKNVKSSVDVYLSQAEPTQRSAIPQQINEYQEKIFKYKQKWEENTDLIRSYQQKLQKSTITDSFEIILSKILYGEIKTLDYNSLETLAHKYQNGLVNCVRELHFFVFGDEVDNSKIYQLSKQLNEKPLIQYLLQKTTSKARQRKKQEKFLKEKQNFINQFEKQTKQLAIQWKIFHEQKNKFEEELNSKRQNFYSELDEKLKTEQKKLEKKLKQKKQKLQQLEEQHSKKCNEYNKEILNHEDRISVLKNELSNLETEFENKFDELEEFQRHFQQLKAEKKNLLVYKTEIDKLKIDLDNKNLELDQKKEEIKQLSLQEELMKDRISSLDKKAKEKLTQLLEIDKKYKEHNDKLTSTILEFNKINGLLEEKYILVHEIQEEIKENEKNLERSKTNLNIWEEKIKNLEELELSTKQTLQQCEIELQKKQIQVKQRQKSVEELTMKQLKLSEDVSNAHQKLAQSKSSLDSLTSLNNAISKMSLHQKQLKNSILQMQIQLQNKTKQRIILEQEIRDLQLEETSLLQRINKIKNL